MKSLERMDWDDLLYFIEAARAGSMSGAAKKLGVSTATMGRRLDQLEEAIGVRLFHRSASGLIATPQAELLLDHARSVRERVDDFLRAADASAPNDFDGEVTITLFETLATHFITPRLAEFRERYPDIRLTMRSEPRLVKLSSRAADIAIRVARFREPRVIAQKIATLRFGLYAHPDYLEKYGAPKEPLRDLSGHALIAYDERFDTIPEVAWLHVRARTSDLVLRFSSASAISSAVHAGAGIGILPRVVASPALVPLYVGDELPTRDVWMAMHEDLREIKRVRAVFDFLREILREQLRDT
jgi:DNA-binding transcriptional LysR family regulator